jgi:adenylate cyclase
MIAVLPFVKMRSDRENEYFVDGLTEEILNRLAQIGALTLRLPGRTSSFAFKGKNIDRRQIETELEVARRVNSWNTCEARRGKRR